MEILENLLMKQLNSQLPMEHADIEMHLHKHEKQLDTISKKIYALEEKVAVQHNQVNRPQMTYQPRISNATNLLDSKYSTGMNPNLFVPDYDSDNE